MIDQLVNTLIQSSWQILILSLIVWPLSRLSIRSYPNFAYLLWVVILLKALIPITISLPAQQIPVAVLSPIITGEFIPVTTAATSSHFSINTFLAIAWLAGVAFLSIKLLLGEMTHRKRMKSAELLTPEVWFEEMKSELNIKQAVQLYMNDHIQSPLMQGLWKARIYLPTEYQSWTRAEKQSVLAHELTHVRRLDIVVIYLQALVKTLYFFHPAVWLVNDQIDLEREKICDDEAIALSESDRDAYGEQLFRQLSEENTEKSVPVLAGGFFMSDSSLIKRFRYIKEKRGDMKNKLRGYHVILILIVTSLAVLIACNTGDPQVPTEPESMGRVPVPNDNVVFTEYDEPPTPVGGYAAVQEAVQYPELAREAGVGGTVIVQVHIDENGVAKSSKVLKGVDELLDKAAREAVMRVRWVPAKQDGIAVSVRLSLPIVFKLKSGGADHSVTSATPVGSKDWDHSPRPENWKAISENIIYPEEAKNAGISGTLTMQFTIDEKGNLIQPKIVNGPDHPALKKAAIHALKSTDWVPAEKDGKPITAIMEMSIGFGTEEEQNKTQKKADGLRPLDRIGNVPVTIKGSNGAEKAKLVSFEIYINSEGNFEAIRGSSASIDDNVIVDQKALETWMNTKWEALPKSARLEGQWINVPLEFTFID